MKCLNLTGRTIKKESRLPAVTGDPKPIINRYRAEYIWEIDRWAILFPAVIPSTGSGDPNQIIVPVPSGPGLTLTTINVGGNITLQWIEEKRRIIRGNCVITTERSAASFEINNLILLSSSGPLPGNPTKISVDNRYHVGHWKDQLVTAAYVASTDTWAEICPAFSPYLRGVVVSPGISKASGIFGGDITPGTGTVLVYIPKANNFGAAWTPWAAEQVENWLFQVIQPYTPVRLELLMTGNLDIAGGGCTSVPAS
jgi:hypothetical protein